MIKTITNGELFIEIIVCLIVLIFLMCVPLWYLMEKGRITKKSIFSMIFGMIISFLLFFLKDGILPFLITILISSIVVGLMSLLEERIWVSILIFIPGILIIIFWISFNINSIGDWWNAI